jgi:putative redox protein
MSEAQHTVAHVHAKLGQPDYAVDVQAGRHRLVSDEPAALGGADAGPGPFPLVLSGLAACTAITLRMYAQRKSWPLAGVEVDARLSREADGSARIERSVTLQGELDAEQVTRLLEICEKTPVTLALKAGAQIRTTLRQPGAA